MTGWILAYIQQRVCVANTATSLGGLPCSPDTVPPVSRPDTVPPVSRPAPTLRPRNEGNLSPCWRRGVRFRLNRVRGAICVSSRETLHNSGHQTSIQNAFCPSSGSIPGIPGFDEQSPPPHHFCIRLHIVVPLASVVSCWMPSIAAEYYMKIFPILQKSGKWLG